MNITPVILFHFPIITLNFGHEYGLIHTETNTL